MPVTSRAADIAKRNAHRHVWITRLDPQIQFGHAAAAFAEDHKPGVPRVDGRCDGRPEARRTVGGQAGVERAHDRARVLFAFAGVLELLDVVADFEVARQAVVLRHGQCQDQGGSIREGHSPSEPNAPTRCFAPARDPGAERRGRRRYSAQ